MDQHLGRQGLPSRDPQLPGHEVEAGDELGDAMLDLEPGVHLQEPPPLGLVDEKLDRRRAVKCDGLRDPSRILGETSSRLCGQVRRRSLLDELLMPALDGAVAFTEDGEATRPVAEQLDLDVPGRLDELFDVDRPVAEGGQRLAPRASRAVSSAPAASTRRTPRPPPPAAALTRIGYPARGPPRQQPPRSRDQQSGRHRTPASTAVRRAASLLPSPSIVSAGGPTKTMPADSTARANAARSLRNP